LLHDLRLVNFGFSLDLVFNDIWTPDGRVRPDVLERPVLLTFRLLGVESLRLTGGLTAAMIEHPNEINWGLSEVSRVLATSVGSRLRLSVRWEGERLIDVEFHRFEIF
jgi:hypothetical protein